MKMYIIPKWISRNIKEYGNSLIPDKVLKYYSEETIIKYYEIMFNCKFTIRKSVIEKGMKPIVIIERVDYES